MKKAIVRQFGRSGSRTNQKPQNVVINYDPLAMTKDEAIAEASTLGLIQPHDAVQAFPTSMTLEEWEAMGKERHALLSAGVKWHQLPCWVGGGATA